MTRLAAYAVGLALASGCTQQPVIEAGRLRILPEFSHPICDGTVRRLAQQVEDFDAMLEGALGEDTVEFYWVPGSTVDSECPEGAAGCAPGRAAYGGLETTGHEFFHAVASGLGRPASIFTEGFAVAFSGDPVPAPRRPQQIRTMAPLDYPTLGYSSAGHFVRFLEDVYGRDELIALYERSDYMDPAEVVLADLATTTGLGVDELQARWDARLDETFVGASHCVGLALPRVDAGWELSRTLDCEQDDVEGPIFDRGPTTPYLRVDYAFEVGRRADFELQIEPRAGFVDLLRCDDDEYVDVVHAPAGTTTFELAPGPYLMRISGVDQSRSDVDLRLAPVGL